jgi:dipeptidyl-peptidase-4
MRITTSSRLLIIVALAIEGLIFSLPARAQLSTNMQEMLRRIDAGEFNAVPAARGGRRAPRGGGGQWVDGGKGYVAVERNTNGNSELIRYDTVSGNRTVQMTEEQLTPPQLGKPLSFVEHKASTDGQTILFSASPRPTMIRKTAYDYWVLNQRTHAWRKLGGGSTNTTNILLYAKLSPDATQAAYVRNNNIFVEDIKTGKIAQLTRDGSSMIINGTSDWVYEEEFGLGDGFNWSPDGKRIAYFQFDQSGVQEFALINYTDALYPVITKYPYPKAGQSNAAVRVGVVSASGAGFTKWMKTPGDPRNTYIARMDWADNSDDVILQHLNRLQSTNTVYLANARNGEIRQMYQDRDDTWVDFNESFTWLDNGKRLLFQTECDGLRHAYAVARDGDARLITKESFDLISVASVDETNGWLYYLARRITRCNATFTARGWTAVAAPSA